MSNVADYLDVFRGLSPYRGVPPDGFLVDFLGTLTDARFRVSFGAPKGSEGALVETRFPRVTDGEGWFEAVSWFEAARAAREQFVMVSLGACYGAQSVGAAKALLAINPMPFKLVTVEAEPGHNERLVQYYRDNGIDPADHWRVQSAISDTNAPVFFPVGATDLGGHNAISTNHPNARQWYFDEFVRRGETEAALQSLLIDNSTGMSREISRGLHAVVELVSAVTLGDVLGPFDAVDLLEADIQQSEVIVFPPFIDLLGRKVRRVHIGTHGPDAHAQMVDLFLSAGWRIDFAFEPDRRHATAAGEFQTSDGILMAVNVGLAR